VPQLTTHVSAAAEKSKPGGNSTIEAFFNHRRPEPARRHNAHPCWLRWKPGYRMCV